MMKQIMKNRFLIICMIITMILSMFPTVTFASTAKNEPTDIVTITITDADMPNDDPDAPVAIEAAIKRQNISNIASITSLKIITSGNAYLSPEDNLYLKNNFGSLTYLDESRCECSSRELTENYLMKSGLANVPYKEFGGLGDFSTLQTLYIPESAQVINSYTIADRGGGINGTGLTSLNIPDQVLLIESGSFFNITSFIGNLVIPDSVIFIGNNAFGAGDKIMDSGTLILGKSVKYIDNNGFKSRKFTGDLVLPDSVEYLGNWVFAPGSFENGRWTIGNGLVHVGDATFNDICSGNTGTLVFRNQWELANSTFKDSKFSKVVFEEGITEITANSLFSSSKNLTEVVFPTTLENIKGTSLFYECTALTSIHLPNGLKSIGGSTFSNSGIVGIMLPENVESIGSKAFMGLPIGSVIYLQSDNCYAEMNIDQDSGGVNRRYDGNNTALAITNGGVFGENTMFNASTFANPVKEGHIFDGWYSKDGSADNDWGDLANTPEAGKTYYAKWTEKADSEIALRNDLRLDKTYDNKAVSLSANDYSVVQGTGKVEYLYQVNEEQVWKDMNRAPKNAGTYRVKVKIAESDTHKSAETGWVEFTISKANPVYKIPMNLTSTFGDTLATVILPDGFTWQDDTLSVGSVGTHTFKATYTPDDTENYNIING